MIKSVLRLAKFPGLQENVLIDHRVTSAFARLSIITSRNIYTTHLCSKEIRSKNIKVKVGSLKYEKLVEGETMPETTFNQ